MYGCENVEFNHSLSKIIFLGCRNCTHEPVRAGRCTVLTQEEFLFFFWSLAREKNQKVEREIFGMTKQMVQSYEEV